jgi:membrane peptidoglycan carboxypeptidase
VIAAVLTTEDGRFFFHSGFNIREIRRALIRNIRAGRPRFGASTISMQLARNLFLYRNRTIARKLQEAVLTWYLEENLSKEEIIALYLNIIEFGPRIFGIRHAAMHYFGRQPDDLSPREAMFIAKLLPSPVSGHEDTYEEGELSPRWRSRIDRALRVMRDRRSITNEEYREAIGQRIVFHRASEPLPPHRYWRARHHDFRGREEMDDSSPERWLEIDIEAEIPAPPDLNDSLGVF